MDKKNQYCTHCAKIGHAKEICFKLHRYPEWFTELAEKKKRYGTDTRALNAVTSETTVGSQQEVLTQNLSAMMSELLQMMKGKTQSDPTQVHFARLGEFVAADSSVILIDGTKHYVTHCGSVGLSHDLSLNAVLHVPSVKHNLLSVSKRDQMTRRTLAMGRLVGSLYVLDSHSFDIDEIKKHSMIMETEICLNAHSNDAALWHRRLGHTPLLVLKHTNVISGRNYELGCTYMLTLVDDRSRATWVFLMKHKSQTMSFIEGFYQMDVIFDEDCFPYKNILEPEHAIPLSISVWDDAQEHEGASSVPILRRSLRQVTKPSWLNDLVCSISDASAASPTITFIAPSHHALMQAIAPLREPTTYLEANASLEWRSAMQAELTALEANKTWEVTPLPPNHTPIGCCWLFVGISINWILITPFYMDIWKKKFICPIRTVILCLKAMYAASRTSIEHITAIKAYLDRLFTIKDLGVAKYFLGLEVAHSSQGIIVTQTKYIKDIVMDTGSLHACAATTPLPPSIKFTEDAGAQLPHPKCYHRLVGRLLYLNFTRLDTSHACQQLVSSCSVPVNDTLMLFSILFATSKGPFTRGCFFLLGIHWSYALILMLIGLVALILDVP
ncbi:uncharacterized protein LOC105158104 [Sesamum indicum]|uniref:Uncharacterized protein LOC105158104 n=1 Tax=Sesamum indicum TaxID=4182 RepID=A0A6I9SSP6_SESIN|nr:uncharacterized protein LOC105158104 [Sesamum indicum]